MEIKNKILYYCIILILSSSLAGCSSKNLNKTAQEVSYSSIQNCRLYTDANWVNDDPEKQFTYGLMVQSPWEAGGTLFLHFPEHLEYNPVGNSILRHWDKIPPPWVISPDGKQASYRVESPFLKDVFVEAFARVQQEDELPSDAVCVRLAMKIINKGTVTLPVIRPLICMQYNGLNGFSKDTKSHYKHNFIAIDNELTALSDLATENSNTTFKGCVVAGCPQHDTRSEATGGLIEKDMDLALSVLTSVDNRRKVIIWWTPGKSMIANANIPCLHADPYFGTANPGEEVLAEGMIIFSEGEIEPIVEYLKRLDKKIF